MKRFPVLSGLMMAAIVALTGCQPKEQAELMPGRILEVTASTDGTKTANSGISTLWAENDALSVYYSNGSEYAAAGKFALTQGEGSKTGTFASETAQSVSSGSHNWYAIYPYREDRVSPASTSKDGGFVYVGDTRGLKQDGYDSMAALCGSACPMYGVALNVPEGSVPGFSMKQLASVIQFNVVNKTGAAVKIAKVTLDESESGEAIVGSFYMDITGDAPVYNNSDAQYISSVASTSVSNATELAADAAAQVYVVVKPYVHDASKAFKVVVEGEVNGKHGVAEVALHPTADKCTFAAGKIKKVTVNVEAFVVDPDPTFVFNTPEGITALGVAVPDSETKETSLDGVTITSSDGIKLSFAKGGANNAPRVWNSSDVLDLRFYNKNILTFTAPSGKSIVSITFAGKNAKKEATSNPEGYASGEWTGKSSMVILTPGDTFNVNTITILTADGEVPIDPWLTVNPESLNLKAAASTSSVTVSSDNDAWTVSTAATWFTVEKDGASVKVTAQANEAEQERSASFEVKHATNASLTANVTVTQAAGEAPGPGPGPGEQPTFVFNTAEGVTALGLAVPDSETKETSLDGVTITSSDGINLSFTKGRANDAPRIWNKNDVLDLRFYNTNTLTFNAPAGKSIASIAFAGSQAKKNAESNPEGYASGSWTGKCSTVIITPSETFYVNTITVTLEDGEVPIDPWLTVSTESVNFEKEAGEATVTVSTDNANWTVDDSETASWLDVNKEGSAIKVACGVNDGEERTTTFAVKHATDASKVCTVTVKQATGNVNTSVIPATIAEFLAAGVVESVSSAQKYQLTGMITDIQQTTYGNFILEDATGSVLVYGLTATEQGIKVSGNSFAGNNDKSFADIGIKEGDTVTIIGYHIIYNGTTHEVIGAYYVSHQAGDALTQLDFRSSASVLVGESKDIHATATPAEAVITYSSSNTGVVTVDANGVIKGIAAGTATVTASVAAVAGSYTAAEKTCTVTVTSQAAQSVTDVLNSKLTGVTGNSYKDWSGKTSNSNAVYAGQSAADKETIQLRSKNSNSGVVTTASGGKVKKIVVTWHGDTADGRKLNVYGSNSAYTAATDLYDSEKQGTLVGSIVKGTSTELEISGDYTFIGFRSDNNAMYLSEVKITWEP